MIDDQGTSSENQFYFFLKYARFAIHINLGYTEIGLIQLPDGINFNFPIIVNQLLLVQI